MRPDNEVWGDEARFWTYGDLKAWLDPVDAKSTLVRGAKSLVDSKCQGGERIGSDPSAEVASPAFVEGLFDPPTGVERAFDVDVEWWEGSLRKNQRGRVSYPLRIRKRFGGAALRAEPRCTVGTVHSVKGGQADVVVVFPDLSQKGWQHGHRLVGGQMTPEPSLRRLFYVAFTRAREKLVICSGDSGFQARLPQP